MNSTIHKKLFTLLTGLLAASLCYQPASYAADIRLGNIFPGSGVIHKKILSIRELRYVDLIPQQYDFSCGAAALATILKYAYGRDVTERSVLLDLFKISDPELVRKKGFSLMDVKRYVQSIGMQGRGYELSVEKLKDILVPTIVLLNLNGYKHFVVLKKVIDGQVYVADPTLGNKIYDLDKFAAMWNGVIFVVIGQGFNKETVLLKPKPALTARKMMPIYRLLTNAELLDFGFSHADLYNF